MNKFLIILMAITWSHCRSQVVTNSADIDNLRQVLLPYNRLIQPAGLQIFFGDQSLENHSLDAALSPDGKLLAVMERFSVVFIRTTDNKVKYRLINNDLPELNQGMNTYSGITWHKSGKGLEVYWSVIGKNNRSYVATAGWNGLKAEFGRLREYKAVAPAK